MDDEEFKKYIQEEVSSARQNGRPTTRVRDTYTGEVLEIPAAFTDIFYEEDFEPYREEFTYGTTTGERPKG